MRNDDFLDIFKKNSLPMLIVDAQTLAIIDANLVALKFYKYSKEEICEINLSDIDYRTAALISRGAHLLSMLDDNFTFEHHLKDGYVKRVKVSASDINAFNKKCILITIFDITSRVVTEEELKKSKDRLKFLMDVSKEVVLIAEYDLIIDANSAIKTQFDWELQDVVGRDVSSLFSESISIKALGIHPIINGKRKFESEFLHKNGNKSLVEVHVSRENYNNSEVNVIIVKDVSTRKRNENLINEQRKYIQNILDSQPALMAVWDNGRIVDTNKSFLAFFKVRDTSEFNIAYPNCVSRLVKMEGYTYVVSGMALIEKAYKNKSNGIETKLAMYPVDSEDVCYFKLDINSSPSIGKCVTTMIDITELETDKNMLKKINTFLTNEVETITCKVNEANLEIQAKEVLLIQQSKMAAMGEMIGAIAHQWKQPLNVINIIVQDFQEAFEENQLDKDAVDFGSKSILKQVAFMSQIISDFASFFKPATNNSKLELLASMKSVEALVKPQLSKANINIDYSDAENGKNICVVGSPNEFKQVILNLMTNAKDAVVSQRKISGNNFDGILKVSITQANNMVVISVSDNGGGIKEDILNKIFDPYISSKGDAGTGIGLYLCKIIINKMNGNILARNSGAGAQFIITLPVA